MKAIELLKHLEEMQSNGVDMDIDIDVEAYDEESNTFIAIPIDHITITSEENRVGRWHTTGINLATHDSKQDGNPIQCINYFAYYTNRDGELCCVFDD